MLKIAYHSAYCHPLPEGHRFPMIKYELLPEQLLYEGTISREQIHIPQQANEQTVLRAHCSDYFKRLKNILLSPREQRKIGFPLSPQLVERELIISQGTVDCAYFALDNKIAMNVAGGTHHAYSNRGEGFCLLNDIAIGALELLAVQKAKQILIVDLDVHQGNGTAEIFRENDQVFTFSMHGAKNYPLKKEKSDLDIALPDHCSDDYYLSQLKNILPPLIDKVEPDFVFYLSGVDVLKTDKLGRLGLSIEACKARDRFVFEQCRANNIPVAVSMGGGYSAKISDIVNAHANTFRLAQEVFF
ncbi:MAG: histone deacetylase [Chitinophagales bacterium]